MLPSKHLTDQMQLEAVVIISAVDLELLGYLLEFHVGFKLKLDFRKKSHIDYVPIEQLQPRKVLVNK